MLYIRVDPIDSLQYLFYLYDR